MKAILYGEQSAGAIIVGIYGDDGELKYVHNFFSDGATAERKKERLKEAHQTMVNCEDWEDFDGNEAGKIDFEGLYPAICYEFKIWNVLVHADEVLKNDSMVGDFIQTNKIEFYLDHAIGYEVIWKHHDRDVPKSRMVDSLEELMHDFGINLEYVDDGFKIYTESGNDSDYVWKTPVETAVIQMIESLPGWPKFQIKRYG